MSEPLSHCVCFQVFKPGVHALQEGEELDYDRTAYDCLHKWDTTWPCLRYAQLPRQNRKVLILKGAAAATFPRATGSRQLLCCSFDVIKDNLGGPRSTFPHTAFMMAGTQAPAGQPNSLEVMKLSELSQGEHGKKVRVAVP